MQHVALIHSFQARSSGSRGELMCGQALANKQRVGAAAYVIIRPADTPGQGPCAPAKTRERGRS